MSEACQGQNINHNSIESWNAFKKLMKSLISYSITIGVGMLLTYVLYFQNGIEIIKANLDWEWGRFFLGFSYFSLVVCLLYLIAVSYHIISCLIKKISNDSWFFSINAYFLIIFIAPNLGILGTFSALHQAMSNLNLNSKLSVLFTGLSNEIGNALITSEFGIFLAIISFLAQFVFDILFKKQEGQNKETNKNEENRLNIFLSLLILFNITYAQGKKNELINNKIKQRLTKNKEQSNENCQYA